MGNDVGFITRLGIGDLSLCDRVFRPDRWSEGFRWLLEHGFVPASWTGNAAGRDNAFIHVVKEADGTRVNVFVARYGDEWLAWCRRYKRHEGPYDGDCGDYAGDTPEKALEGMIEDVGLKLEKEANGK